MLSKGLVERRPASWRGSNVAVLAPYARSGIPIVGTEPSCILTLRDEYLDLLPDDADAAAVAGEVFMIDEFLAKLDEGRRPRHHLEGRRRPRGALPRPLPPEGADRHGAVDGDPRAAGCAATESGAGCCGMAGSFGYEAEHYEVSRKIGEERLFPAVDAAERGRPTIAVAGVSCRQQIEHFTGRKTRHIAEVLADRIAPGHVWASRAPEPVPDSVTPTPELAVHAKQTGAGPA